MLKALGKELADEQGVKLRYCSVIADSEELPDDGWWKVCDGWYDHWSLSIAEQTDQYRIEVYSACRANDYYWPCWAMRLVAGQWCQAAGDSTGMTMLFWPASRAGDGKITVVPTDWSERWWPVDGSAWNLWYGRCCWHWRVMNCGMENDL